MKLFMVRHGQSTANVDKSVYATTNDALIPLTPLGESQAAEVGNTLISMHRNMYTPQVDLIACSPFKRARDTAKIIRDAFADDLLIAPQLVESPLLRERAWGSLRDEYTQYSSRAARDHLFDFYRSPYGGESFADVYTRAALFLQNLQATSHKNVVIVSHGEFIKVLLMILDGVEVENFNSLPHIKNCEIVSRIFHTPCIYGAVSY